MPDSVKKEVFKDMNQIKVVFVCLVYMTENREVFGKEEGRPITVCVEKPVLVEGIKESEDTIFVRIKSPLKIGGGVN